jgi:hypothetical protein
MHQFYYRQSRKRKNSLAENCLSPPKVFRPLSTTQSGSKCPHQDHLATTTKNENACPSYPRAQAPQDQLKTARNAQTPTQRQKGDEDTSKPAVLKHKICRLSTQTCREEHTCHLFPSSSPSMNKRKRVARRKAINACYQSATLTIPSSPSNSQQCRVEEIDTSKTRAGEFGIEAVDGKWRMSENMSTYCRFYHSRHKPDNSLRP